MKHENFKTCDQSGFCKRNRAYADAATSLSSSWEAPYALDSGSITFKNGQLKGIVAKTVITTGDNIRLPVVISFLQSGSARVTIDEERRQKKDIELRRESKARKERYDEAVDWAIVGGLDVSKAAMLSRDTAKGISAIKYGPNNAFEAVIQHRPLRIDFKRDGETHVTFNERGFMNMEHWRKKVEKEEKEIKDGEESTEKQVEEKTGGEDESTWWDESFGGTLDTKPRGPESVGLDISFPNYKHVFGIPEHASSLSLKETRYVAHMPNILQQLI